MYIMYIHSLVCHQQADRLATELCTPGSCSLQLARLGKATVKFKLTSTMEQPAELQELLCDGTAFFDLKSWVKVINRLVPRPSSRHGMSNATLTTQQVVALGKAKRWAEALALSLQPPHGTPLNIITVGAAAAACARAQRWGEATDMLGACRRAQLEVNVFLGSTAINAWAKEKKWSEAFYSLSQLRNHKLEVNSFCFNPAISSSEWTLGLSCLAEMGCHAVPHETVSFNAAISAGSPWEVSAMLFETLRLTNLQPSMVTYGAAITGCRWQVALELLGQLQDGINLVILNSAVSSCAAARQWEAAVFLLNSAQIHTIQADLVTYTSAMSACAWELSLALFDRMLLVRQADVISCSTLLAACSERWEVACALLASLPQLLLKPDVVCFNAALSACEASGVWEHGLALLEHLRSAALHASWVTYNTVIGACGAGQVWQKSLQLLEEMAHCKVEADAGSFNAALSALPVRQWQRILNLLNEMKRRQLPQDVTSFTSAVSACGRAGSHGAYSAAVDLLQQMPREVLRPNAVTYAELLSGLEATRHRPGGDAARRNAAREASHFFRCLADEAMSDMAENENSKKRISKKL